MPQIPTLGNRYFENVPSSIPEIIESVMVETKAPEVKNKRVKRNFVNLFAFSLGFIVVFALIFVLSLQ